MSNETLNERIAKIETSIGYIADSVNRIEALSKDTADKLERHVEWEERQKYPELEAKFATNERAEKIEKDIDAHDQEIGDMPSKLKSDFAAIWVEGWVKVMGFTLVASIIGGAIVGFFLK